eukprot:SAG11_NODE_14671_length_603_cov_3.478175_2_plen_74_part_01
MQGVLDSWKRTYGELRDDVYDWSESSDEEKTPADYRRASKLLPTQIPREYDTIETFSHNNADSINELFEEHAAR